jgi:hypothetical protein
MEELTEEEKAEIANQIVEGYTSGINDSDDKRVTWEIKVEKFCLFCNGTGEVYVNEDTTQKCICKKKPSVEEEMDDNS